MKRPQDNYKHWSGDDEDLVRKLYQTPGGKEIIMRKTGRTEKAVEYRAYLLGCTKKRHITTKGKNCRPSKFKTPPPPRKDLLKTRVCPRDGYMLWSEMVPSDEGYVAVGKLDLVCIAGHRFKAK